MFILSLKFLEVCETTFYIAIKRIVLSNLRDPLVHFLLCNLQINLSRSLHAAFLALFRVFDLRSVPEVK